MSEGIKYRKIDGEMLPCQDIGCDDFDRAEHNRYIIANHLFCEAYTFVEESIRHTSANQPLAKGIPLGELPVVGKHAQRSYSGEHDDR